MTSSYQKIVRNYIEHERFLKLIRQVNRNIDDVTHFELSPSWYDGFMRIRVRFVYVKVDGSQSSCITNVPQNFSEMGRFANHWDFMEMEDINKVSYDLFYTDRLPNYNCQYESRTISKVVKVDGKREIQTSNTVSVKSEFEDLACGEVRTRTQYACERLRLRLWEAAEEYRTSDRFREESAIYLRNEIKTQFKRVVKPFGKVSDELLSEAFREFIVESVLES